MSTEYTPTTESVRTDYVMAYAERESSQLLAGIDFDRWLAAHDRAVKAEALREAADAYLSEFGTWGGAAKGAWLRARADEMEASND